MPPSGSRNWHQLAVTSLGFIGCIGVATSIVYTDTSLAPLLLELGAALVLFAFLEVVIESRAVNREAKLETELKATEERLSTSIESLALVARAGNVREPSDLETLADSFESLNDESLGLGAMALRARAHVERLKTRERLLLSTPISQLGPAELEEVAGFLVRRSIAYRARASAMRKGVIEEARNVEMEQGRGVSRRFQRLADWMASRARISLG